ncbi:hypothetical protein [Aquamicrobium sp. LC103]|uniref:hypothetical protein n=1 Tax=Aquamicrobium sp. LC103 TaxID=1120658 RepID=UPI000659ACD8|nr:hypothetical protein [Aquamicrobium sp. LC103]TKT69062.1 hypothetical protein XW59_029215 [Aquamicrobium sp. LC103]
MNFKERASAVLQFMSVAAYALFFAEPLFAQAIPHYDVSRFCQNANGSGSQGDAFLDCVKHEQEAFDQLLFHWQDIEKQRRRVCDQMARAQGSTYRVLKLCIDDRAERAS